jgi:hypothetical protein
MRAVRRQTATSGINPAGGGRPQGGEPHYIARRSPIPAGSSRALRLDPLSLPLSFHAHDTRADGGVRRVELHRERVVLHRAIKGMRMAINVRVSDFLGVALRGLDDEAQILVLAHRDPSLNIPLCVSSDAEEIATSWQMWSDILALPLLTEDNDREPAARRRRHNAVRDRRPKFLMRRRLGNLDNIDTVHRDEREIIARD